jgi:hypothetical protein
LDDPEAFLSAFEPTYAVVITDEIVRGEPPNIYHWGPDGDGYWLLTPSVTCGYTQAPLEFQKAVDRRRGKPQIPFSARPGKTVAGRS